MNGGSCKAVAWWGKEPQHRERRKQPSCFALSAILQLLRKQGKGCFGIDINQVNIADMETTREFILHVANGEYSDNDILNYLDGVKDVKALIDDLELSSVIVPRGYDKPIVNDEAIHRIDRAISIIFQQYNTNTTCAEPNFMKLDKVVKAFDKAVEQSYMTKQDGRYKWIKDKGTLLCALLGTMLYGDYVSNGDYRTKGGAESFPVKDIEGYFGLKDISKKRYQLNGKKPPRGYETMIKSLIEQP